MDTDLGVGVDLGIDLDRAVDLDGGCLGQETNEHVAQDSTVPKSSYRNYCLGLVQAPLKGVLGILQRGFGVPFGLTRVVVMII